LAEKPETIFNIDSLFVDINRAFITAAANLRDEFETDDKWKESPFIYHMPKMHLSMRLALSHSNGKVKGVFKKKTSKNEESIVSTLEIDVVAVPRQSVIAEPASKAPA
jgi:hypothetical protein